MHWTFARIFRALSRIYKSVEADSSFIGPTYVGAIASGKTAICGRGPRPLACFGFAVAVAELSTVTGMIPGGLLAGVMLKWDLEAEDISSCAGY